MNRLNRVAIIGMGLVNSEAQGTEDFVSKRSNPQALQLQPDDSGVTYIKINEVDYDKYLHGISLRCIDEITKYSGTAANMALGNYISGNDIDPNNIGIVLGSSLGSIVSISNFDIQALTKGAASVNPVEFPNTVSNAPTSKVGIWFKLKGPSVTISNGVTSSLDAVGFAFDEIAYGKAEYYLAGGAEEISSTVFNGYKTVIGEKTDGTSQRTSKEIIGEGAGMMFLSTMDIAAGNKYKIYGEVVDFFSSKVIVDKHFAVNIKNIVSAMADANNICEREMAVFSSRMPNNHLSEIAFDELLKHYGPERVLYLNENEDMPVNYLGMNGIFNSIHAIEKLHNGSNLKAALIYDIGCDGKLSCVLIKNA